MEVDKEGEGYTIMSLKPEIAPFDLVVLPLFDKDGMDKMARDILTRINSFRGIIAEIDTSRSIGRRYARADEIGIPWAVTIDHQSLEDNTVTVRRRDDQRQVRTDLDGLIGGLKSGSLSSMF